MEQDSAIDCETTLINLINKMTMNLNKINSLVLLVSMLSLSMLFAPVSNAQPVGQKLRVLVLTDIENEPDDAESMVRFMTYSNMWDVEGLVATTSIHQKDKIADWRIREIVTAYGKVRNNLLLHEPGYATESYMQSIIKKSYANYGMNAVGEGKDSEGSDWIISVVDKKDDRPCMDTCLGWRQLSGTGIMESTAYKNQGSGRTICFKIKGLYYQRPG
jgi:hypothetical protein